ncbi:WD40 repeat domain-containing protein [Flavobacterium poyangense]|uniref:hypothetical protein n=1 Tax=Flavobacterium poyangense TaxID=2204302 RepID=UPI00141FFEA8|nr:hypothetical protein [Flavobacterium sp. JXAS1]
MFNPFIQYDFGTKQTNTITYSQNFKTDLFQHLGTSLNPTGTLLYTTLHNSPDAVAQYKLNTPWNVTTASYLSNSLVINQNGESSPRGHYLSPDGTKLYVGGSTSKSILYYTLSTAWDVSTAVYVTFLSLPININSIHFSPDGRFMFLKNNGIQLQKYTLSTNWDITTAILTQTASDTFDGYDVYFTEDGSCFFTYNGNNRVVIKKSLAVPWDLATVEATAYLNVSSVIPLGNFESIHFSDNGLYLFIGVYFSSIYRFELSKPFDIKGTLVLT